MPSFTPRRVAKPEVPVADVPSNVKFALPVINPEVPVAVSM